MPIDNGNLALKGLDDLFSTEENRQEEQREQVQQIPIDALHPFTNHPFKVLDNESMTRTVESIAQYGVLAPLIARPRPDGDGYEIISGHRRQYAAKLAGLETLPVIVRNMDDNAAVLLMVDSNLQREHILPSERAFAYKMKLEALKNQGARSDLTSPQNAAKFRSDDQALLKGQRKYPVALGKDPLGCIIRLDNSLNNFPERITSAENELATLKQQQEAAQIEVEKPFPQEEELAEKSARLAELNAQLDMDEKGHEPEQDEEEQEDEPRRPSVLAALEEKADKVEPIKPFKSFLDKDGDAR